MKRIIFSIICFLSFAYINIDAQNLYSTKFDIPYTSKTDDYSKGRLKLDIHYHSERKDLPVVIWFHGGGLTGGEKYISSELRNNGYVVVAPNYRLMPNIGVEECIDDAAEAVAWTFKNISQFGGDPSKIFVAGHSAGGFLASMIGLEKKWLSKYGVDADSIIGLVPFSGQVITHSADRKTKGIGVLTPYVDEHAPLFHVRNNCPPYIIITGDPELEMYGRYEENLYMWRMMRLVGHPDVKIYKLDGYNHDTMIAPAHQILISEISRILSRSDATGISLDVTSKSLIEGESFSLTATIAPYNANDKTVTWTSSDSSVATVTGGTVTAVAPGSAVITAFTLNGLSAACSVNVEPKIYEATGITLDVTEKTLTEGESFSLNATIDPPNTTDKTVIWTSSDTSVAIVTGGTVTAVAPGSAVITGTTSNGFTATCIVTVEPKIILATEIILDKNSIEAEVGSTFTLIAEVLPNETTNKTVVWSSSDESVASVDQNGNVTIVSIGTAVIKVETTDGSNLYEDCHVTGISSVETLFIDSEKIDIYSLAGSLIRKNVSSDDFVTLEKGTYIIRTATMSYEIIK